jgi:molybdopterin-containing oxidoreductase family membrane subunit
MNQRTGLVVSAALTAIGAIGVLMLLIKGHGVMGTSHQFPWGIFISAYVFFVLIGSGLCLISSLGSVFGIEPFTAITRRSVVLAMITLMAGFLIMGLETPQPLHMIYMIFSPNFSSAIFWMGSLYGVYLIFLTGEFWYMIIGNNQPRAHLFGLLAFFSALAASSNLGAVFGFLHARPYWEGAYMPVYFILSAILSGSAALIILYYLLEGRESISSILPATAKLMALCLSITLFFSVWKLLTGLYGNIPGKAEASAALLIGPYALNFWGLEIGLGMIVPLFLLLVTRTRKATFVAALMSMTGIFFMRYDMVMAGQVVPLDVIDQSPLPVTYLSYSPTWVELAIVCLGFGFVGLAYLFAEKRLKLDEPETIG